MNYSEAIKYIENTAKFGSNLGLERTEKILELLGNPHRKLKCIHIAGTNGKGSISAMLSKVLMEAGFKVGMYTSPYIEEFEERIQINGSNILKDQLSEVITKVAFAVDKVIELGYEHPTEFEIITCAMFLYYYEQKVDIAVIEVGLGGRLDSTNVIKPILSIIASISYDHINVLGSTLKDIAFEKSGIIKEGVSLVLYPQKKESFEVIKKVCEGKNSPLICVDKNCISNVDKKIFNEPYQKFRVNGNKDNYNVELSLLGVHQLLNCAVVIRAVEILNDNGISITKESILKGLKDVKWPGRLEIMRKEPLVVLDGAHNIDGIINLKRSVHNYFKYNKLILILGILADKQVEDMIKVIAFDAYKVIAVAPHNYRAESSKKLCEVIKKYNNNCENIEDYKEAYEKALSYVKKGDMILICGSLYMIGDMRKVIKNN